MVLTSSADAAFRVEIYVDGVLQAGVDDGGPGDLNPAVDAISIIDGADGVSVGNFALIIDTAISNAVSGIGAPIATLTNTVNAISQVGGSLLEVLVSATNYPFPGTADSILNSSLTNNLAVSGGGTVEFQSWADAGNALFGLGTTTGLQTLDAAVVAVDVAPPAAFSDPALPFSLTNLTAIRLNNAGSTLLVTGATTVSPVPEPGSIALLAMGGASLFGYGWRRRKAQAV